MVNYPNGMKKKATVQLRSTSNRGMDLEHEINITNQYYLDNDIAVIYKKPTPITIVKVDYPKRSAAKITEAYFQIPSTTDYNGIYEGKYVDFEAKECSSRTSFPLKSIHAHQLRHLDAIIKNGGIGFLIIRFTLYNETYFVKAMDLFAFIKANSRKSIPYTWFKENCDLIPVSYIKPVDYLQVVNREYFKKGGETSNG